MIYQEHDAAGIIDDLIVGNGKRIMRREFGEVQERRSGVNRLHIDPVAPAVAADRLRRQLAWLESSRHADVAEGRLGDLEIEMPPPPGTWPLVSPRGEQKRFRVGLYLTVHARTPNRPRPSAPV